MSDPNPLHAACYADRARQLNSEILENVRLAKDTWRVRLPAAEIAQTITPGQFVMLRLAGRSDPLLGRPLAMYDVVRNEAGRPWAIDLVYLVHGKFTAQLSRARPGEPLVVWGPLGNGFSRAECDHLILVAGGIGQTPFLSLAAERLGQRQYGASNEAHPVRRVPRVTFCYGARTADYFAGLDDFAALGPELELRLSTNDGSRGRRGLVTDELREVLSSAGGESRRIAACGPEPMLAAVSEVAAQFNVPCEVSLETPMACGVGICFTCVAKVRDSAGDWDYKRTCVDGPVFDSRQIVW